MRYIMLVTDISRAFPLEDR